MRRGAPPMRVLRVVARLHPFDRSDGARSVIRELRPEAIYHLAAQSSTGDSLVDPWATLGNNLHAQLN